MTYVPNTDLSSMTNEAAPSTFDKLKTLVKESADRSQRINQILRRAFSETRSEFNEGRTVITPLAKEVTTEAVSTFKTKGQEAAEAVNKAWQDDADAPDLVDKLANVVKILSQATREKLFPQAKRQASKLDTLLSDRYGDQYVSFKTRLETVRTWVVGADAVQPDTEPDIAKTADSDAPSIVIEVDSEVV